ncbi:hypothetical protein TNCT_588181 [Trichonephila clavata]|uniref:Uncharacterized protein n=1 Tax=Trichonephila clavata TaxID=2740835 RepID=A0A8X6HJX8_TRICU|nr:hypothetical protein TNCT_588181 [Trichonephila clavata]
MSAHSNASRLMKLLDDFLVYNHMWMIFLSVRRTSETSLSNFFNMASYLNQISDFAGRGPANSIMETLNKLGINSRYMVGQGYDGAAAMSGSLQGAQQHISSVHDNDMVFK